MVFQIGPKQIFFLWEGLDVESLPNCISRHSRKGEKKKQRGKHQRGKGKQQPKRGGLHRRKAATKH